jgi:alkylhydroperoxidase family enzyme
MSAELLDRVLGPRDEVRLALEAAHEAAWAAVDPRLLELCRLRVAQLLGAADELVGTTLDRSTFEALRSWPSAPQFDRRDRACLAFCEAFVIDVANLDDELALSVAGHLGESGLADLTAALLVVEQRQRLALAWRRLGLGAGA